MKKIFPFLLIGGAVAIYFYSKAGAAKKLRVYFKSLTVGKTSGWKLPEIFAQFRIVNPTNTALSIDSIAGDIYFNRNLLASVQNLQKITIPANQETIYNIKLNISAFDIVNTVYQYLKNKEKINVSFQGTVNSSGVVFPLNQVIIQQ